MIVGAYTYGHNHIKVFWEDTGQQLIIGKFCSIAAEGVRVLLGGEHQVRWTSTYPFGEINQDSFPGPAAAGMRLLKGDVNIGNDVWIASYVTIMSGVTIGDGAVIAANSHVVKDVGTYEVWGGNPARLIRKRFDDKIIDQLMLMRWWDLPVEQINKLIPYLQQIPTDETISKMWEIISTDK